MGELDGAGLFEQLQRADRAEQLHAPHVEGLARHVFGSHVDGAVEAEECGGGGGSDAVLACAGFGDDARFADGFRQECLAEDVVDFVAAGVVEVFAFEDHPRVAAVLGELGHLGDDGGAAGIGAP